MKNIRIKTFLVVGLTILLSASCRKEAENIFTMFGGVTVTFHDDSPYSVVDYKLVNDGDSVHISFTIASEEEDMMKVVVDSTRGNGQTGQREILTKEHERRSYSTVLKHKMNRDGKMTWRIYALNRLNNYIGDGYTSVTVEGAPSYTHLPNRRIYAPIPEVTDLSSFYSISQGSAFSYIEGGANSAHIDFGLYVLSDTRPEPNLGRAAYNIYSINVPENPFPPYDISGWDKRNTLFSRPITNGSNTFNNVLVSSSTIETEAKQHTIDLLQTSITQWDQALAAGNLVYFLTPEGKYGAIFVNQVATDFNGRWFLNISTKTQR